MEAPSEAPSHDDSLDFLFQDLASNHATDDTAKERAVRRGVQHGLDRHRVDAPIGALDVWCAADVVEQLVQHGAVLVKSPRMRDTVMRVAGQSYDNAHSTRDASGAVRDAVDVRLSLAPAHGEAMATARLNRAHTRLRLAKHAGANELLTACSPNGPWPHAGEKRRRQEFFEGQQLGECAVVHGCAYDVDCPEKRIGLDALERCVDVTDRMTPTGPATAKAKRELLNDLKQYRAALTTLTRVGARVAGTVEQLVNNPDMAVLSKRVVQGSVSEVQLFFDMVQSTEEIRRMPEALAHKVDEARKNAACTKEALNVFDQAYARYAELKDAGAPRELLCDHAVDTASHSAAAKSHLDALEAVKTTEQQHARAVEMACEAQVARDQNGIDDTPVGHALLGRCVAALAAARPEAFETYE
jgi:hypothetical protein